jgi:hypothetical protein
MLSAECVGSEQSNWGSEAFQGLGQLRPILQFFVGLILLECFKSLGVVLDHNQFAPFLVNDAIEFVVDFEEGRGIAVVEFSEF